MILYFLLNTLFADEPVIVNEPSETAVVEAYRDIHVYVSPIQVHNLTWKKEIESIIDTDAAFTYSGRLWRNSKILNERGTWDNAGYSGQKVKLYNERTIGYAHDNCNYALDGLGCSINNSHYFLETIIHVDDHQLVIKTTLYDSDAQIISSAVRTNDMVITWIKQQEITVIQNQTREGTQTITHKPKEEMPLKWEIPHMLLDKDLAAAMRGLWVGAKLSN